MLALDQRVLVLANLVRTPMVIHKALNTLRPEDFDPSEEPLALIWAISRDFFRQTNQTIPKPYLLAELSNRPLGEMGEIRPDGTPTEKRRLLLDVIESIYETITDADLVPQFALSYLQEWLDERCVASIDLSSNNVPDLILSMNREYARTRVTASAAADMFNVESDSVETIDSPRIPTGFRALDELTAGGLKASEMLGVLAPTGGGKTTFSIQLSNSYVSTGRHVIYGSYEQSPIEIRDRVWACGARVPIKSIEGKRFRRPGKEPLAVDMHPDIQAKVSEIAPSLQTYFHLFDMRGPQAGFGGAEELENVIRDEINQGRPPSLLVVDWMGLLASNYADRLMTTGKRRDINLHEVMNQLFAKFVSIKSTYHVNILILQQLSGASAGKSAGSRRTGSDAASCRSFANLLDSCIIIDNIAVKEIGLTSFAQVKGRNDGPSKVNVRLDPQTNSFNLTDHRQLSMQGASGAFHTMTDDIVL